MSVCLRVDRWMRLFLLPVFFALFTIGGARAAEQTKPLTVLGAASLHNQDIATARREAILEARVAAVGQAVAEMLSTETMINRFQAINEKIFGLPDQYVTNYRVLNEAASDQTIRTLVSVDVAIDALGRDLSRLGLSMAGTVPPRILFMLAETNVGEHAPTLWWGDQRHSRPTVGEEVMATALRAAGCEIVDIPELTAPLGLASAASDADMLALARRLGADVLLAGTAAAALPLGVGSDVVTAEVVVRALNVGNGQPMGQSRQHAETAGADPQKAGREALSTASAAVADDLAPQILAAWQQDAGHHALITVVVGGINGQIAGFVRLRAAVAALPGVKELLMKEMTADQAVMAVNYSGSSRSLADAVSLSAATDFNVEIDAVSEDNIQLRLVQP